MDTKKKIPDAFEDTKKVINTLSEEKLNDYDKDDLIEISLGLSDELKKVFREMKKLTVEKEKLKARVEKLETVKQPTSKYEGYPRNKDYITKLLFILSKNENDMTFEDIVNAFYQMESDLHEKWRNPNKSISKIISRACNFQVVTRKKAYENSGYYIYGLFK